jgi:hypothetical protein
MPEENKDTCRNYELLAMWRKFRCPRRTKTHAGIMDCWQCGASSDAWGEQRHMQELWTAGNVAQVQMPEGNKDTCRNYGLLAMWRKFRCLRRTKTHTGINGMLASLYSTNWSVSITQQTCVYCAVRTEYILVQYRLVLVLIFKGQHLTLIFVKCRKVRTPWYKNKYMGYWQ